MMFSRNVAISLLSACLVATPVVAQDGTAERDMAAVHCVDIRNIDSIDILNDRALVFRMRTGNSYRNDLPRDCPGLREDATLMYRPSVGRLCDIDMVTILDDQGFGLAPGASCGLGMFYPIDEHPVASPAQSGN